MRGLEHISLWPKTPRHHAPFSPSGAFFQRQFLADCTINVFGFNFDKDSRRTPDQSAPPLKARLAVTDLNTIVFEIAAEMAARPDRGEVANYIPELARVDPGAFGMAVIDADGDTSAAGDADTPFSIQSISKVFTLTLALGMVGDQLWRRVGREPSGDPFNSIVQLEHERGVPRNPFINAGAIAVRASGRQRSHRQRGAVAFRRVGCARSAHPGSRNAHQRDAKLQSCSIVSSGGRPAPSGGLGRKSGDVQRDAHEPLRSGTGRQLRDRLLGEEPECVERRAADRQCVAL